MLSPIPGRCRRHLRQVRTSNGPCGPRADVHRDLNLCVPQDAHRQAKMNEPLAEVAQAVSSTGLEIFSTCRFWPLYAG